MNIISFLEKLLFRSVDIIFLAMFRIAFGLFMLIDVFQYFYKGWIQANYIDPIFHFKFYGLSWIQPWPGSGMVFHFLVLGILAFFILLGIFYRFSIVAFFFAYTYMILIDATVFVEWNYLIALLSFLLIFLPADRYFSVEVFQHKHKEIRTVPAWMLWLLRFQFGIVYFFSGLWKINEDWINGDLIRGWLAYGYEIPFVGTLQGTNQALVLGLSWAAIIFDCTIVGFLLWKRTRLFAFIAAVLFHLHNVWRFEVGIFPFLMLAGTALFFEPDAMRRTVLNVKRYFKRFKARESESKSLQNDFCTRVYPRVPKREYYTNFRMLWFTSNTNTFSSCSLSR